MVKVLVRGDMTLGEVIDRYPAAVPVMLRYGLHCVGCHVAASETVEQGAAAHGLNPTDVKKLLADLNKAARKK